MKVRIAYTKELTDEFRRAMRCRVGQCGTLATRQEYIDHAVQTGNSTDADVMTEYESCETCNPVKP